MEYYIGSIIAWAPDFAPKYWAFCDGKELPIASYTALYSVIGTTYGGDGKTTFALPNLNGRVIVGNNYSSTTPKKGGNETVSLTSNQMPMHTHELMGNINGNTHGVNYPSETSGLGIMKSGIRAINMYNKKPSVEEDMVKFSPESILPCGEGMAHSNVQPYQTLNYIICINGFYPPRP